MQHVEQPKFSFFYSFHVGQFGYTYRASIERNHLTSCTVRTKRKVLRENLNYYHYWTLTLPLFLLLLPPF